MGLTDLILIIKKNIHLELHSSAFFPLINGSNSNNFRWSFWVCRFQCFKSHHQASRHHKIYYQKVLSWKLFYQEKFSTNSTHVLFTLSRFFLPHWQLPIGYSSKRKLMNAFFFFKIINTYKYSLNCRKTEREQSITDTRTWRGPRERWLAYDSGILLRLGLGLAMEPSGELARDSPSCWCIHITFPSRPSSSFSFLTSRAKFSPSCQCWLDGRHQSCATRTGPLFSIFLQACQFAHSRTVLFDVCHRAARD